MQILGFFLVLIRTSSIPALPEPVLNRDEGGERKSRQNLQPHAPLLYIPPMPLIERASMRSPVGIVEIKGDMRGILSVMLVEEQEDLPDPAMDSVLMCLAQLEEYFAKKRRQFEVPLSTEGTPFQKSVWKRIAAVPFGETITYGIIANDLGLNGGAQAVGGAVGANPVCIIVPCHRIVGSGGMGGYAYGLERKKWLLEHENDQ